MNEEEIIEDLTKYISFANKSENFSNDNDFKWNTEISQRVQGLLDLYNKEKEKNKELENADLTTVYMNGFYDGEKTWKDKIKDKIIFYKRYGKIKNSDEDVMSIEIEVLQELLEE